MGVRSEQGTVCVTGGACFLASWIIKRLLEQGYSVRTTVQSNPEFKEDVSHITNLPGASKNLKIYEADFGKPDSFFDAINGCIGVFHVAHPTDFTGKTSQEEMIKISVEGTLGILKSCIDSKTVKRVIYTSSTVAAGLGMSIEDTKEINEQMWTNVDDFRNTLNAPGISYAVSKTITERAAIEFAQEHGLDLVTLLPSMVVGPFLGSYLPMSVSFGLSLIFGNEELLKHMKPTSVVDIDDVVSAQIFLFECSEAKGRYICSRDEKTIHQVGRFLQKKYPELKMQTEILKEIEEEEEPVHTSSKKLMSLGFKFKYEFEEMYDKTIKCCIEKGFL